MQKQKLEKISIFNSLDVKLKFLMNWVKLTQFSVESSQVKLKICVIQLKSSWKCKQLDFKLSWIQNVNLKLNLIISLIMNWLIRCEINEEMKNFSDHLSIQTIINLRVCKKSVQKSRCNWKIMNEKKFINILKEQMLKSLLNHKMKHQCINEYIKQLLNALKKIIKISTFWARSHEMIKAKWTKKCMKIIKSMQWMRRSC